MPRGAFQRFAASPLGDWILPSFSDFFLIAILVWLFLAGASGWKALLMDGDTGWHIRTGEYILDHRAIPVKDLFSFSKPGAEWFAWEWLADLVFGCLWRLSGLKGVVLFSGIVIAVYSTILLRFALWKGANVMVALPVTLLAVGSSSIHFLARPHLFTLLLLPSALWILERDRRRPDRYVWCLVPLMIAWTNLHGGFAVFLVCLGLLVAGTILEGCLGTPDWSSVRRYSLLLAACALSTLVNPFGIGLHRHILGYLNADWIRNLVQEFQAPTFRSEGQLQFEVLLIAGMMLVARLLPQRKITEALWVLFFAHSALTSVRHAPLYAAVAAPLLASELSALWKKWSRREKRQSIPRILYDLGQDLTPAFQRNTMWCCVTLILVATISPVAWPSDFPQEAFPVALVHRHSAEFEARRVFTTDQWADYLIYSFYPGQRVFIDGRSDFYGENLGKEYLALMQGTPRSRAILDKYAFQLVLVPAEWPLAQSLRSNSAWSVLEDDGKAVLFRLHSTNLSLMETAKSAESISRSTK